MPKTPYRSLYLELEAELLWLKTQQQSVWTQPQSVFNVRPTSISHTSRTWLKMWGRNMQKGGKRRHLFAPLPRSSSRSSLPRNSLSSLWSLLSLQKEVTTDLFRSYHSYSTLSFCNGVTVLTFCPSIPGKPIAPWGEKRWELGVKTCSLGTQSVCVKCSWHAINL